jgi:heme-degrading monooxygenase HmoA
MFARLSTYQVPPEAMEEMIRNAEQTVIPAAKQLPGEKGALLLVDRQTGKAVTVTLWEDEQAMRQSEERANELRSQVAGSQGKIMDVERYEVAVSNLS